MSGYEKWLGLAAGVIVVLFILHTFAPASIKSSLGIS
jgi:hypothetical protein